MFRKLLDEGRAGENVGALLRGTKRDDVERGQVLSAKGSINPHTKFESEVAALSEDEGGRHTPFFKGYRPQFYFRTTDVTGDITLPEGVEMVMPGDNVQMTVELTLQSQWTKVHVSQSAKVAVQLVLVLWKRISADRDRRTLFIRRTALKRKLRLPLLFF